MIRILNTYGPRMHPNDGRVVSNFITQALAGEDVTIFGDGSRRGMIRVMGTPDDFTGPINIGNPREFTIRELAERVIRLTGSKSKLVFKPLPIDDPKQRQPDITLARDLLDWSPTIELEEGLERTIRYFREQCKAFAMIVAPEGRKTRLSGGSDTRLAQGAAAR